MTYRTGLTFAFIAVLAWSMYQPKEFFTWILEALPVLTGSVIVYTTYRRFPLTSLSYCLLWLGAALVLIGAHYTYAEVPAFDWLRDYFKLERNHYDRFGHFFQGVIPAIVIRELLLRTSPLIRGFWLSFIIVSVSLAKSALYELAEWLAAIIFGDATLSFLGTQGDIWDAQKDMGLALIGSIVSLLIFSRLHDRQLQKLHR